MIRLLIIAGLALLSTTLSAQGRCLSGNCQNGQGRMQLTSGLIYQGAFKRGKFQGVGLLKYPDGATYAGNFFDNLQQGTGRYTDAQGNSYLGGWFQGKRHGEGEVTYANGSTVRGNWAFDKMAGTSEFRFANGDFYRGEMVGEMVTGYGTMQYSNGDSYTGEWVANRRQGQGKMVFADQSELEGSWGDDEFQADWGLLGYQGDTENAPDCNQGCAGSGKFRYNNGITFYGRIENGQPTGNGTVTFNDGNTYHGGFSNNRSNGLGIMYYADGQIQGGLWKDGTLYRRLFTATGRPVREIAVDYDPAVKIWAVVVGAARYNHMRTLKYTDDDAYQVYAFLKSVEGGALPDEQVKLLIDDNATHRNVIMAMRDVYLRADENDVVLFYFSGHGLQGAFLPVDYDGFENRLEHYQLRDALLASRARHKLVIADACHSGSLGGRQAIASRGGGIGGVNDALEAFYQGLNNASASTALLLSSKGEEISLEDGGLRSGIFSHFLIRGMKGEADENNDQLVSISELFNFVHREVRQYTGNIQTPTLTGSYDDNMPVAVIRKR